MSTFGVGSESVASAAISSNGFDNGQLDPSFNWDPVSDLVVNDAGQINYDEYIAF